MKSSIIGTAGHIDHGKTALVKALTGIDADRLEEEKRRGITIDLGFAHLELPGPGGEKLRLGFIDVPGHERFIRNMLAGVGGIDLVLFVIAADEGIKPQTREHFDICRLLGVKRGITVLTKSDLVDPETLNGVKLEVVAFLRGSFLDGAPIIPVSSLTGAGLDALKQELARIAAEAPARDSHALTRLPIDRVFTMKGFGTVVTGTLVSGAIRKEDELEVFPSGERVRVRGIQVHDQSTDRACAGQRTALNLAGVERNELARGMVLSPPETFRTTQRVDVSLSLLSSARPLKRRAKVHFHAHTAETTAEVIPHNGKEIAPGATVFADLRLAGPMLLLPGDRFVLRQFSPLVTIGGGVVLDAAPIPRLKRETVEQLLNASAAHDEEAMLTARIARRCSQGLPLAQAIAETGWRKEKIASLLLKPLAVRTVLQLGDLFLDASAWNDLQVLLPQALEQFHQHHPLAAGMGREVLREKLTLGSEVFAAVLNSFVLQKKLEIVGDIVHLPGRGVVMKEDEAESKRIIEESFKSAGLTVPALKDVLSNLKLDKARAQKIVTLLLREKTLIKIADDLVFHHATLTALKKSMTRYKEKSSKINVAQFKDLTGVSRKYAIPLLEYLDRERITRRVGDQREIL
jgi:selenocysteine-specific elongation factor